MTLQVECHRCGYDWKYTGNSEYYASCPQCKTSVPLEGAPEQEGRTQDSPAEPPQDGARETDVEGLAERVEQLESTASELHTAIETMMSRVSELEAMRADPAAAASDGGAQQMSGTSVDSSGAGSGRTAETARGDRRQATSPEQPTATGRNAVDPDPTESTGRTGQDARSGRVDGGGARRNGGTTQSETGSRASGGGIRPESDEDGSYDYICPECDGPISGKPDACIHCGTGFTW